MTVGRDGRERELEFEVDDPFERKARECSTIELAGVTHKHIVYVMKRVLLKRHMPLAGSHHSRRY